MIFLNCKLTITKTTHHVLTRWTVHHGEKRKLTTRRQTRQSSYSGYETRSQDFRLSKFVIYKEIQTINTLMRDYCTASVKAPHEPIHIYFSYLLKGQNKHEWTSECILYAFISRHYFSSLSPPVHLLICLICGRDTAGHVHINIAYFVTLYNNNYCFCIILFRVGVDVDVIKHNLIGKTFNLL